jgi:hypothetical protein
MNRKSVAIIRFSLRERGRREAISAATLPSGFAFARE